MLLIEYRFDCGFSVQFEVTNRQVDVEHYRNVFSREADTRHKSTCSFCRNQGIERETPAQVVVAATPTEEGPGMGLGEPM